MSEVAHGGVSRCRAVATTKQRRWQRSGDVVQWCSLEMATASMSGLAYGGFKLCFCLYVSLFFIGFGGSTMGDLFIAIYSVICFKFWFVGCVWWKMVYGGWCERK